MNLLTILKTALEKFAVFLYNKLWSKFYIHFFENKFFSTRGRHHVTTKLYDVKFLAQIAIQQKNQAFLQRSSIWSGVQFLHRFFFEEQCKIEPSFPIMRKAVIPISFKLYRKSIRNFTLMRCLLQIEKFHFHEKRRFRIRSPNYIEDHCCKNIFCRMVCRTQNFMGCNFFPYYT